MKNLITSALIALGTSAQAGPINIHDLADVASTQLALTHGFVEGNTSLYSASPTAAQMIAAKVIVRAAIGDHEGLNKFADTVSTAAAVNNMALIAGASNAVAPVVGAAVAAFIVMDKPPHEPPTKCERGQRLVAGRVCVE